MEKTKINHQLDMKRSLPVFGVFICLLAIIIFALTQNGLFQAQQFLSFSLNEFIKTVGLGSVFLILYSVVLTYITPPDQVDETNKSYQNNSTFTILIFMGLVVVFEELLFRGIIQNALLVFFSSEWLAILLTALLFIVFHFQYFKRPLMLLNIAIPSFIFCYVYSFTNNIFVPIIVHFLMNTVITLLFKYEFLKLRNSK